MMYRMILIDPSQHGIRRIMWKKASKYELYPLYMAQKWMDQCSPQCSYRNHKSRDISISRRHPRGRKKNSTESAATGNRCALLRTEKSPYGTKNSHPGLTIHVAAQIAALRRIDVECVLVSTYRNTKNVYNI
ncbi:hypothetical protein CEXT_621351 [Caerostris extrusa]|uniref:Uncharacterized protein n=1 Tax=Caerostris extrusa TaxID=172846 RepID=A0AAV4V1K2_CAEEX|nr:hypothetical protein CEXT_621351 [Caerostris extrusa]